MESDNKKESLLPATDRPEYAKINRFPVITWIILFAVIIIALICFFIAYKAKDPNIKEKFIGCFFLFIPAIILLFIVSVSNTISYLFGFIFKNKLKSAETAYSRGKYNYAIQILHELALEGNAEAQKLLGDCYYYGNGVNKSYAEAAQWYRKSAELGNVKAQTCYGYCYEKGLGLTQSYKEAVKWYTKAADNKGIIGTYNLGVCNYYGYGVPQSYTTAVTLFKKVARKYIKAKFDIGHCYYHGYGVKKSKKRASAYYHDAIEQNFAPAVRAYNFIKEEQNRGKNKFRKAMGW